MLNSPLGGVAGDLLSLIRRQGLYFLDVSVSGGGERL